MYASLMIQMPARDKDELPTGHILRIDVVGSWNFPSTVAEIARYFANIADNIKIEWIDKKYEGFLP